MKFYFSGTAVVFFCLMLSACAGPVTMSPQADQGAILRETARQRELQYKREVEEHAYLYNTAFPVLTVNADYCGADTLPQHGLALWNLDRLPREYHAAARALYGVTGKLSVQMTATGSPAARSGLQQGDIIISINGVPIPTGWHAIKTAQNLLKQAGYNESQVYFDRAGVVKTAILKPVAGCKWPVILDPSQEINALTDGTVIVVTHGIMRFTERRDELAMVIAHELAHNVMGHLSKQQQNSMIGSLGGLAVDALLGAAGVGTGNEFSKLGAQMGGMAFSVPFEQEADYVGMYFMERAGYNSAGVADFWRRMAVDDSSTIGLRTSHPATPERFLAIEAAHTEILEKKARRLALTPNFAKK